MSRDFIQVHFHILYSIPDIIIITGRSNRESQIEIEENVEMQRCGAYQVVRLSRQKVTMKDNPAYVDVNIRTLA